MILPYQFYCADYLGKFNWFHVNNPMVEPLSVDSSRWVAMGKSLSHTTCSNYAMPRFHQANGSKICDLWSLDILHGTLETNKKGH
ncbi:hypothetical protein TNCT_98291 [Trichonephila clavata]|uniref:Uncharacterized protein n=1 Tax=Trichonephila clavata TaxID=2740835 RepID=A0A8X6FPN8_TRICU|nr:hypothetical protein TNCT_98291 [Trichonephila clavata]